MPIADILIIAVYLLGLFAWAIYIGLGQTAQDFLVFSRRAPLYLVFFSIVATWVGVGTTVATAASAYEKGISLGLTACAGGIVGALGGALFAPRLKEFGDRFDAHTIGDFFRVRYAGSTGRVAGALILVIYVLLTAAQLVGLSAMLKVWFGIPFTTMVALAAVSTIAYTAFAGIKSDFYTDIIHFLVMFVVLFLVLMPVAMAKIGGVQGLAALPQTYFDPFAYGGPTFFVAGLIFGGGSVFVTMELWQRVYASSSKQVARWSLGLSILAIVLFYAVSTLLGMAARLLLPDIAHRDQALFALMRDLLPTGLLGLGIAGLIAILVSTLNSTLMVASATVTKDFWYGDIRRQGVDQGILLRVGRVSTLACGALGFLVAVALPDMVALSVNGMFMLLVLLPAIAGGFAWKRATAVAATSSMLAGAAVTGALLPLIPDIAFVPGFVASLVVFIVVSLLTPHSAEENVCIAASWQGSGEGLSIAEEVQHATENTYRTPQGH